MGIAKYITKYMAKDFETGDLNQKRYWAGGDWPAPQRVTMLFPRVGDGIDSTLLAMVFEEVVGSAVEFTHWLSPDGFVYWVAALGPPRNKGV
jgi:hypothetical protein